jgi:hypothetical protein
MDHCRFFLDGPSRSVRFGIQWRFRICACSSITLLNGIAFAAAHKLGAARLV